MDRTILIQQTQADIANVDTAHDHRFQIVLCLVLLPPGPPSRVNQNKHIKALSGARDE